MPTGDDKKLRVLPSIRLERSRSASPRPSPRSTPLRLKAAIAIPRAKSDNSVNLCPGPAPKVTRSVSNMAQKAIDIALKKSIAATDRVTQFEANLHTPAAPDTDRLPPGMCQIHRDQIRALWEKVEKSYESCSDLLAEADDPPTIASELESKAAFQPTQASASSQPPPSTGCRLPPVDTEVFTGDYIRWPTFRDLFTAIYIQSSRLTPVEKLFHLLSKTCGDAHAIVSKAPLTNEGFISAWQSLTERFENRRLLVNSQLKILFNLPAVPQESGAALKELQGTIQSCLTALSMSSIQVKAWDCLLVYMVSTKLPKTTLSMWEQSVHNKAEIPTWNELNSFLTERHRTLEAIDDIRPSSSGQFPPRSTPASAPARRLNSYEARETPAPRGRHHTLLHRDNPAATVSRPSAPSSPRPAPIVRSAAASDDHSNVQVCFASGSKAVLLGTAIIDICHLGRTFQARALIDSGSEATFITERLLNIVKLPSQPTQTQVSGLNDTVAAQATKLCKFSIRAPSRPGLQLQTTAYVLPQLAGKLPSYPVPRDFLKQLPDLPLADPAFFESSDIDVLIGADILPSVLLGGSKNNIFGSLLAQETIFGWVLTGPVSTTATGGVSVFSTRISVSSKSSPGKFLAARSAAGLESRRTRGTQSYRCRVCSGFHPLRKCQQFLKFCAVTYEGLTSTHRDRSGRQTSSRFLVLPLPSLPTFVRYGPFDVF
ncbi:uncharacterized protein [Drosophila kikkawai]|uniref:Peptidase A2 domain-containing protein n=1 Tax=Drosophila kikkawai TaxID=30033 RepID=A0ABM4GPM1_DROKI